MSISRLTLDAAKQCECIHVMHWGCIFMYTHIQICMRVILSHGSSCKTAQTLSDWFIVYISSRDLFGHHQGTKGNPAPFLIFAVIGIIFSFSSGSLVSRA